MSASFSCCCRGIEDDDDGVFSRSVAVVSVRLRVGGTDPTSVTLDAAAGVVAPAKEEEEKSCLAEVSGESAKGRVTSP